LVSIILNNKGLEYITSRLPDGIFFI
jgi:hypothetical protein